MLGYDTERSTDHGWGPRLLGVVAGAVPADDSGALSELRQGLSWYPDQVWRWLLACQWHRLAQEEAFVTRTAEVGDETGSAVTAARLTRDMMRLALLLDRRYAPYQKWLGTASRKAGTPTVCQGNWPTPSTHPTPGRANPRSPRPTAAALTVTMTRPSPIRSTHPSGHITRGPAECSWLTASLTPVWRPLPTRRSRPAPHRFRRPGRRQHRRAVHSSDIPESRRSLRRRSDLDVPIPLTDR